MASNRKRLKPDELEVLEKYRAIKQKSLDYGIDPKNVRGGWLKFDKTASLHFKNPAFEDPDDPDPLENLDLTKIFKKKIKPIKVERHNRRKLSGLFDRLVYTDTHIGMNPNADGYSMYGGKWDEEEVEKRLAIIVSHIIENQNSNTLYIDDLGDFMDGWNKLTTRGGHELPQNMDNQKAYDVGVLFKVRMINELVKYYNKIICHNVCNNNHGGAFDYVVNSAFKSVIELQYKGKVEVNNLRKYIEHYVIETNDKYNYGFILCHGKDEKENKFGFKPKLDDKDQKKIDNYIDENFLFNKNLVLEFSKGDTHLELFDSSTAARFNYFNYPALSPSSNYIQTNFQKGKSGFSFFNYKPQSKRPAWNPLEFDWYK